MPGASTKNSLAHPSLARQSHRPWPIPARRWTWRQSWLELLFAHWPVEPGLLRPLLPPGLELDLWDNQAWLGVVPFRMEGVTRRPLPDLPWLSAFPEINVRTYVRQVGRPGGSPDGRPGVWFLSLDATNPLAVWAARRWFHLPYHRARIDARRTDHGVAYLSERADCAACFAAEYRPTSDPFEATPGTLEHWLTERYCLYAPRPDGGMTRTEVHHVPWPLQHAEATIMENSMAAPHGVDCAGPPATLHYAERIDVAVWSPELLPRYSS
ncbi:hypothetical protein Pla123a_15870 [Posidoniimonas polymericola]|uniref:DUF2071 domain-containing protein n=1 Tax=Posidoniimonas polymericola TaxID=2528002 RepID=A0A5C5YSL6_9BACT|nr:DUF2071 domain-containing protein [Posidoniimonas polymericola]TWT77791.1 hypothetical protein Pla123a_15870 [Posidoniimonas polymericola]